MPAAARIRYGEIQPRSAGLKLMSMPPGGPCSCHRLADSAVRSSLGSWLCLCLLRVAATGVEVRAAIGLVDVAVEVDEELVDGRLHRVKQRPREQPSDQDAGA